jgi:hypothetical protein
MLGVHDLGRVFATPAYHSQRMSFVSFDADQSAISDSDFHPTSGWADATDSLALLGCIAL